MLLLLYQDLQNKIYSFLSNEQIAILKCVCKSIIGQNFDLELEAKYIFDELCDSSIMDIDKFIDLLDENIHLITSGLLNNFSCNIVGRILITCVGRGIKNIDKLSNIVIKMLCKNGFEIFVYQRFYLLEIFVYNCKISSEMIQHIVSPKEDVILYFLRELADNLHFPIVDILKHLEFVRLNLNVAVIYNFINGFYEYLFLKNACYEHLISTKELNNATLLIEYITKHIVKKSSIRIYNGMSKLQKIIILARFCHVEKLNKFVKSLLQGIIFINQYELDNLKIIIY